MHQHAPTSAQSRSIGIQGGWLMAPTGRHASVCFRVVSQRRRPTATVGTTIRRPQRADIAAGLVDTSSAGIDSTAVRQLPGHCGHTARHRLNGRSRRPPPLAFAKRPAAPVLSRHPATAPPTLAALKMGPAAHPFTPAKTSPNSSLPHLSQESGRMKPLAEVRAQVDPFTASYD